jgi:hypothetical protein
MRCNIPEMDAANHIMVMLCFASAQYHKHLQLFLIDEPFDKTTKPMTCYWSSIQKQNEVLKIDCFEGRHVTLAPVRLAYASGRKPVFQGYRTK